MHRAERIAIGGTTPMTADATLADMYRVLRRTARDRETITYRELAARMGLEPPGVIRRVTRLLEETMREDAAAGRPFLAAVVVSRTEGLPRPGFFQAASELGRHRGAWTGREAREFFKTEYEAAIAHWSAGGH